MPNSLPQILTIVGPTATGKTTLAVELAKLFPSVLISADSRQVYRGMDIVTGKDHPQDQVLQGIDLVDPDEDCSVSLWYKKVSPYVKNALNSNKLPILVGGTGLYFNAFAGKINSMYIPPNPELRKSLNSLSVSNLQAKLSQLDLEKFNHMNHSDRHNPRRLIRAIEILSSPNHQQSPAPKYDLLTLGLRYHDHAKYQELIYSRVLSRLEEGALAETKKLLSQYSPKSPSFTSLGYPHLISYLNQKITYQQLIDLWVQEELSYVKRQLTWFNKFLVVNWFEPSSSLVNKVAPLVKDWYHNK
jgi:tRNA dimethylallyltransferase